MNKSVIDNIINSKNIVIPLYIYKLFPKFDIDLEHFVFLMYLYSNGKKFIFDTKKISSETGLDIHLVLLYIDKLSNLGFINICLEKNEKNISEEYLNLSGFFDKLSLMLISQDSNDIVKDSNENFIFEKIEKEFGRVLSPMEYEIIKAWHENGINDDLINEALKEAVYNGVNNLRYLDRILYEWQKKGFKSKEDIEKNRKEYRKKNEKIEVFEYNWLEDDE